MKRTMKHVLLGMAAIGFLLPAVSYGRIKLVALPERMASIIRLDNPGATLIEEERDLTLQKGLNKVDFSWNGVSIDVDSIRLKVLDHPDKVTLLNVSYPPNEAALVWEIASDEARQEKVRISYLLRNIDRLITYKALTDKDETKVDLKSYLILRNFSGEDFDAAKVLLDYGEAFERDIQHEETKQLLFLERDAVPITKVWTWDARRLPWDPEKVPDQNIGIPVSYRIKNDSASKLGDYALWGGKVRLFQDDGHDSTIFLGEDVTGLVPIGEKTELNLGDSRDIVVTQRKKDYRELNVVRNKRGNVVLKDVEELIETKIENFKDKPAVLTMIQSIPGEWDMVECNLKYKLEDAATLKFEIELPARTEDGPSVVDLTMRYRMKHIR